MSASAVWYLADRLPPFRADPMVFGERDPSGPKAGPLGPLRQCAVHEATWRGDAPCWLCVTPNQPTERGSHAEIHPLSEA